MRHRASAVDLSFRSTKPKLSPVEIYLVDLIRSKIGQHSQTRKAVQDVTSNKDGQKHDTDLTVGPRVDWPRIQSLLSACLQYHEYCQNQPTTPLPPNFRVLDVDEERLVMPAPGSPFVALSYVWGTRADGTAQLEASKANIEALERHISIEDLPRTLRDAVTACRSLGQRYLWIDRLCIVQDDETKHGQIAGMAAIYASAVVVLITVTGAHAGMPIPGVSEDRPTSSLNGLPWKVMGKETRWWTRGWTYQEAVLARRKLFFGPSEAWMECGYFVQREMDSPGIDRTRVVYDYSTSIRDISRLQNLPDILEWIHHLGAYTERSLTYPSDIYDAFSGITASLYDTKGGSLYGMPRADFDQALLWTSKYGEDLIDRIAPGVQLPTWSWASAANSIASTKNLDTIIRFEHFVGSLVVWFEVREVDQKKILKPLVPSNNPVNWAKWLQIFGPGKAATASLWVSPQLYMFLAVREGLFDVGNNKPAKELKLVNSNDFHAIELEMGNRWPRYEEFYADMLASRKAPLFTAVELMRPGIIITQAQVARFGIDTLPFRQKPASFAAITMFRIVDDKGQLVGTFSSRRACEAFSQESKHPIVPQYQFMGVSIASMIDENAFFSRLGSEQETKRQRELQLNYFDENDKPLEHAPAVNVLMIDSRHPISRRIGIGWIYMTKWVAAERYVRTVALE